MTKVFISAPFFSKEQIAKVKAVEQALAANPTVDEYYSPRLHQEGDGYKPFTPKWCKATYRHDLENAVNCDVDVEILDFDKDDSDSGTAFEYGFAKAKGQFVTTILFNKYPQNLMLGVGSDHHFDNISELKHYDFNKRERKPFTGKMH